MTLTTQAAFFGLALALGMAVPLSAQTRWRAVHSDARVTIAIDTTTVRSHGGGLFSVWVNFAWPKGQTLKNGTRYTSAKDRNYINCTDGTIGTGGVVDADSDGNVVYSFADYGPFAVTMEVPIPDTYGEDIVKQFCAIGWK